VHPACAFAAGSAVSDEQNLVSSAGLVPVLELAGQTGLSRLVGDHVDLPSTRVKSGAVNPIGKLNSIINAMMCGADSIDDANVLCAGGTPHLTEELPVHADDLAEFGGDRSLCIKAMIEKVVPDVRRDRRQPVLSLNPWTGDFERASGGLG
jgi:hypothetical protein